MADMQAEQREVDHPCKQLDRPSYDSWTRITKIIVKIVIKTIVEVKARIKTNREAKDVMTAKKTRPTAVSTLGWRGGDPGDDSQDSLFIFKTLFQIFAQIYY